MKVHGIKVQYRQIASLLASHYPESSQAISIQADKAWEHVDALNQAEHDLRLYRQVSQEHNEIAAMLQIQAKLEAVKAELPLAIRKARRLEAQIGQSRRELIGSLLAQIKAMSLTARIALKAAYVHSARVPREDREDMLQELFYSCLKSGTDSEALAYTIAKRDVQDYWKLKRIHSQFQFISLDSLKESEEWDNIEAKASLYAEYLIGMTEYQEIEESDAFDRMWKRLPRQIQPIVSKRLQGKALSGSDRVALHRYVKSNPCVLTV